MEERSPYHDTWYSTFETSSRESARVVVPMLIELFDPASVVDVGCGEGVWLSVFMERGVRDVLGMDGPHVRRERLKIDPERFEARDLSGPIPVERRFDLALSFEVAEHLPERAARPFVRALTRLAPVVAFGAAIPHQGGTGHVNEQWPGYWVSLFEEQGYEVVDCLRGRIWDDERVTWWYAQNLLVFVEPERLRASPELERLAGATNHHQLALVHPKKFLALAERYRRSPGVRLAAAARRRWARLRRAAGRLASRAAVGGRRP